MARVAEYREHMLDYAEGAHDRPFRAGVRASEIAMILRMWELDEICAFREYLDDLPAMVVREGAFNPVHRPMKYPPSTKFFFHVAEAVTRRPMTACYEMVQEEPELRALIDLPPPSAETLRQLESPASEQKWVKEPGVFPAYQTINSFPKWLAFAERRLARVRRPKLTDAEIPVFARFDRLVHVEIPAAAAIRHDLDFSLGAIDAAGIRSPVTKRAKIRKDGSADTLSKGNDEYWWGRRRMSHVAGTEGMIIASLMTVEAEIPAGAEQLIPASQRNIDEINQLCAERGHAPATISNPVLFGDSLFNCNRVMRAAHKSNFDALFRHRDFGQRRIIGSRTLRTAGGQTIEVVVCNDGTHLCPCQWTKLGRRRRTPPIEADLEALARLNPMEQLAGKPGEHVEMRCIAPDCHFPGRRYRVPHPIHDDGTADLTAINRIVRWDMQNQANLFKATQSIERMHSSLDPSDPDPEKTILPPITRRLGDDAASFGSLLADLRINLYILDNLDHNRVTYRYPDVEDTFRNAINKTRGIFKILKKELPAIPRHHLMDGAGKRRQQTDGTPKRRQRGKAPPPAQLPAAA